MHFITGITRLSNEIFNKGECEIKEEKGRKNTLLK